MAKGEQNITLSWRGRCYKNPFSDSGLGLVNVSIRGLVVEYVVAIDVTRVRFPADAIISAFQNFGVSLFWFSKFRIPVAGVSDFGCGLSDALLV